MKYKIVLERKVTYVAVFEVEADNFENAKAKAIGLADGSTTTTTTTTTTAAAAAATCWREAHSATALKSIMQE